MPDIKDTQAVRGKVYGAFEDHSKTVDKIMQQLRAVNETKNNTHEPVWPEGFETAMFYMTSKLVRLATSPEHQDSALDLSSYADLWLEVIKKDS